MTPFFSVVIPVYNRENRIEATLDSLRNQSFTNFETIVVDDCSTDNSFIIARNHTLENKIVLKNEVNSERCITRNRGIEEAKGEYICFLDSDDLFLEDHLEVFHNYLIERGKPTALLFTNSYLETESGERTKKIVPPFPQQNKFSYLLKYTPNPARVCVSTEIVKTLKFDPEIAGIEDLDLWLRIASKHTVVHIEKYTNVYCIHSEMYTLGDAQRYEKELQHFKKVFSKPELKGNLPKKSRNRLLSMCYFHLAQKYEANGERLKMYRSIIKSFWLYPPGYNGKTNKILFVSFIYNIPLLGLLLKRLRK